MFKVYCTVNNKEKHGIEAFLCLPCGTRVLSVLCPDSSRNGPAAWAQPPQARVRKEEEKQLHSCCPGCPGVKRAYLCVFGGEPLRGCVCAGVFVFIGLGSGVCLSVHLAVFTCYE